MLGNVRPQHEMSSRGVSVSTHRVQDRAWLVNSPARYFKLASRRFAFSAASLPGYLAIRVSRVFFAAVFLPISCWLLAMLSIASGALALSGKVLNQFLLSGDCVFKVAQREIRITDPVLGTRQIT